MPRFGESPIKKNNEDCNFVDEESVPEEKSSVNGVPSFSSQFNFSEKKGHKMHPDDFNLLKGYTAEVGAKTHRIHRHPKIISSKTILEMMNVAKSPVSTTFYDNYINFLYWK